ncbi:MAG: TIGR04552 family protein [Victivallales bacterium]|nr:TIGR04552 family protein [Victivallales bacterium]
MKQALDTTFEPYRTLDEFTLFDLELVRVILRGGSVLDWHRLNPEPSEINALLRTHLVNLSDSEDLVFLERIRDEAVIYLRETLSFPIPKPLRKAGIVDLLAMAGDRKNRHRQFCACVLLKTMHTVNHFDAEQARQALAMADQELFQAAERRIYRTLSNMMAAGLPVVEFIGGRKQRSSMITKLLSKGTLAAQVFDKMRFRVITSTMADVMPVINYLARNLFPFNYGLSSECYNTLFSFRNVCTEHPHLKTIFRDLQLDSDVDDYHDALTENKHSSPEYHVVHWVTDMPIRIPNFQDAFVTDGIDPIPRPIVYIRTELQILDRQTHRQNERGDAAHSKYKERQRHTVINRLKLGLVKPTDL